MWEKGTNRSQFLRGEVNKYTWVDIGSSFLPGELIAAFLWAQLESAHAMTSERLRLWQRYADDCAALQPLGVRCPIVPDYAAHNAHLFYLLLPDGVSRVAVLTDLNNRGVNAIFHYVPLHDSPGGRRYGRTGSRMDVTTDLSGRLIRLPIWVGLQPADVDRVVGSVTESLMQYV
jgi:dTDP-4-amino-4,6-dideoxygalactose transaminase